MPVTFEGTLKIFVKKEFTGKLGETVSYFEAFFLGVDENDNDVVVQLNTKQDLTQYVDRSGIAHITIQSDGKKKLTSFQPN